MLRVTSLQPGHKNVGRSLPAACHVQARSSFEKFTGNVAKQNCTSAVSTDNNICVAVYSRCSLCLCPALQALQTCCCSSIQAIHTFVQIFSSKDAGHYQSCPSLCATHYAYVSILSAHWRIPHNRSINNQQRLQHEYDTLLSVKLQQLLGMVRLQMLHACQIEVSSAGSLLTVC